jgi:hypothetical protein
MIMDVSLVGAENRLTYDETKAFPAATKIAAHVYST